MSTKAIHTKPARNVAKKVKFTSSHISSSKEILSITSNALRGGGGGYDLRMSNALTKCLGQTIVESYLRKHGLGIMQRKYGQEIGLLVTTNGKKIMVCSKGTCVPYCHPHYDCDVEVGSHVCRPDYYCFVRIQGKVVSGSTKGGCKTYDHNGFNKAFICGFIPYKKIAKKDREVHNSKGNLLYRCAVEDLVQLY